MSEQLCFTSIGIIHSEHTDPEKTPIQPCYAEDCYGQVEVFPQYADGLRDLEGYSHIYLIYRHHKAGNPQMMVRPFLQNIERGVFSTRVPHRPNPIGLSIVRLLSCEGRVLYIGGVDILNGTPLLDIKPYSRRIDCIHGTRNGWQDEVEDADAQILGRRGYRMSEDKSAQWI